ARNLLADFPSYCPEIPCHTSSMPAEFLCNLPKNLTTHLTHKLYSVFPYFPLPSEQRRLPQGGNWNARSC
ncbi:MAG: hypothetical protein MSH13_08515, partial [Ruminococcus callidus]|nr:hypothetical protein [Ruminococcus callidus]